MEKKKKEDQFNLKELMSTPRGKAVVFFGVYVVFFFVIAILARTGGSSAGNGANKVYETGGEAQFSLANIENNNYKFNYEIVIDGATNVYSGSRTVDNSLFKYNDIAEYYFNGNVYFTNSNGVWINAINPYIYSEFLDVDSIEKLIERSTYISKTTYESGKEVFRFDISSATISKLFENVDLDIEEIPNEIIIGTDENNYVDEIKFTLDSYCKAKKLCVNNMSIKLNYELYGEIEEITSPLE